MTLITGCSSNIVFFLEISKSISDSGLFRFSLGVSVCTPDFTLEKKNRQMAGRTPVPQHQNWQSSENHSILRKSTIFNEHPVPTCVGLLLVKYQNWKDLTDMWTDGGKGRNSIFFYTSHFHFVKKIKSQIIFVCKGGPWIHENIIHM